MNISPQHPAEPNSSQFAANIPKYFAFRMAWGFSHGLIITLWVIYLQQRGLSLTQVTLVDVAFWLAVTLGEVPTGIVADKFGRKISLAIGAAMMGVSIVAWAVAPTLLLITTAYVGLAIGATFLSGADDAFFYESLQRLGRRDDYTRLVGQASALMLGAMALGSLASGLLASFGLIIPFLLAGLCHFMMLGIVLTFRESSGREPQDTEKTGGQPRISYRQILQRSLVMLRARPQLRYPLLYLTLLPVAAVLMETVFLQPQALAFGVPLAGMGVIMVVIQLTRMAGSTWSHPLGQLVGEGRLLHSAPVLIILSLLLLAMLQQLPALLFITVISFVTTLLRPILMSRIQHAVSDDIRATILSMQSLLYSLLVAIIEPMIGLVADQAGLPAAYVALAATLAVLVVVLFWQSNSE